jgi:formylglycine-generating enzyme required for sulfatase activity
MSVLTFVTIGDAGNAADTTGYGDVSYAYDISKFEITEGNIAEYNADPANSTRLITIDPSRGTDKPATSVSWNEAARYVNWLNIEEGFQPAYNFTTSGVNDNITLWSSAEAWQTDGENRFRHKDAKYFLPSEDEWYKAAYYNGSVYFDYPTGSNNPPAPISSGTDPETAVYDGQSGPADVTQAGGLSPYETMGQGGNIYEWIESAVDGVNDLTTENRVLRGGYWNVNSNDLQSSFRNTGLNPVVEGLAIGFRVARNLNANPVSVTFVTIGDAGNAADTTGYGDVSYAYDISKFEITEGNIAVYNADPVNSTRQITIDSRGTDKPATSVSWNEAARYVNWLNIKEGIQPAYYFTTSGVNDNITLWSSGEAWQLDGENLYRHKDAKYFLPSEDEWYKAAYYKSVGVNAGYWLYPTGSDTAPTAVASGTTTETAVFGNQSDPADVDQAGGLSPYGTIGQGGNVNDLIESSGDGNNDSAGETRVIRGGDWFAALGLLRSDLRNVSLPGGNSIFTGFRVTSFVPPVPFSSNTSPVLNLADNLKMGSTQVTAAYLDSVRVWPTYDGIWRFDTPSPGTTITGFKITTSSGGVFVDWGDGSTDLVNSGQTINKTY